MYSTRNKPHRPRQRSFYCLPLILACMKLSIIVAMEDRPTLARMARSMVDAGIRSCDEVIVVTDGKAETKRAMACLPASVIVKRHPATDEKHRAGVLRNYGMPLASSNFLMFMDDDDVYTQGAGQGEVSHRKNARRTGSDAVPHGGPLGGDLVEVVRRMASESGVVQKCRHTDVCHPQPSPHLPSRYRAS